MFVFQYFRCVYIQNNMQIIPLYEMTGGMLESSDGQVVCLWNVVSQLLQQFLSHVNKTLLHMIPMNSSRAGHIFCEGDAPCFWNVHISIKSFVSQTTFIDFKSSKWLKVNLSYLLCQSVDKGYNSWTKSLIALFYFPSMMTHHLHCTCYFQCFQSIVAAMYSIHDHVQCKLCWNHEKNHTEN